MNTLLMDHQLEARTAEIEVPKMVLPDDLVLGPMSMEGEQSCINCRKEVDFYLPCGCHRCPRHGWTSILTAGHNSGFAGEGVWWVDYKCGCGDIEEGEYF